jgi:hypothetical protein
MPLLRAFLIFPLTLSLAVVISCGPTVSADDVPRVLAKALTAYIRDSTCSIAEEDPIFVAIYPLYSGDRELLEFDHSAVRVPAHNLRFVAHSDVENLKNQHGSVTYLEVLFWLKEYHFMVELYQATDHATIYPEDPDSEIETVVIVTPRRCTEEYRCELRYGRWVCNEAGSDA